MNTKVPEMTRHLRLQLLEMSRVSQRAVDYSIKAYKVGIPELCANVRDSSPEINILHREVTQIAQDLLLTELPRGSDTRFALSAVLICDALRALHAQAVKIAANSMRLSENGRTPGHTGLNRMGGVVNLMMRLCIIALFEEDAAHAETVLNAHGVERLFASSFDDWSTNVDQPLRPQVACELEITRCLRQMATETYEIAGAILFWLNGTDDRLVSDIDEEKIATHAVPAKQGEGVTHLPDWMAAFRAEVDACLADSSNRQL